MTDYPRCKTCKHWNATAKQRQTGDNGCECKHPKLARAYQRDSLWAMCEVQLSEMTWDTTEATPTTGADFGCIHHEAKP